MTKSKLYLADYHVHSATSPDGKLTVSELAEVAVGAHLDEICVTDHVDTVLWGNHTPRDSFDWSRLLRELPEARERYRGRLVIRLGAELGEAPMGFDRAEKLLEESPGLDFVIGSVHMAGEKFKHFDLYYIEKRDETYYHKVIDSYLEDVMRLAQWGRFSVLGHLTLPLRYINENLGEHMTFEKHYDQCREIFRALIRNGCGIECNTNRGNVPLPDAPLLRMYREEGGEIITLGSDAHTAEFVGCRIRETQQLLRECGFRYFTVFAGGKPEFRGL